MVTFSQQLLKILKAIDLFGSSIHINYKNDHKLRTQFGGTLTIIAFLFAAGLAWVLGKEIIYKDNPLLIFTKIQKNLSEVLMQDVPIFMDFLDKDGNPLPNPETVIDFYAEQVFFIRKGNTFTTTINSNFTLERCHPLKHFGKYSSLLSSIYIKENAMCINVDNTTSFYNDYASIPSSYFGVGLRICNNNTRQEGNKCSNQTYLNEIWKKFYVRCAMPDFFIDPLMYDKPVTLYLYTKIQDVSTEYNFRNYFQIQNSEIITDKGWFSEDIHTEHVTQFSGIIPDVGTSLPSDPNLKYYVSFESPCLGDQYKRSYLKIPDVIANLGGVMNILFIFGKLLSYKINEVSMYLQESKDLVNFNEDDLGEIINQNSQVIPLKDATSIIQENTNSDIKKKQSSSIKLLCQGNGKESISNEGATKLDNEENTLNLNKRKIRVEVSNLTKIKVESTKLKQRISMSKMISDKGKIKENFNINIKQKVEDLVKDASGNYLRKKINFCGFLAVTLYSPRHDPDAKNRKTLYDSIIFFFKNKADIRNIIKQSNDVEILKYLILGNYSNYDQLFNIKFSLDQIVKDSEFNRLTGQKKERDEDKERTASDDKEENDYQKEVRNILEIMKDNFNRNKLFD